MLRGLYSPSDFSSQNLEPKLTPEQKLEIINASPVTLMPSTLLGKIF